MTTATPQAATVTSDVVDTCIEKKIRNVRVSVGVFASASSMCYRNLVDDGCR